MASLGSILPRPTPLTPELSDEHKQKLIEILTKLNDQNIDPESIKAVAETYKKAHSTIDPGWQSKVNSMAPPELSGALPKNLQPLTDTPQQATAARQGQDQTGIVGKLLGLPDSTGTGSTTDRIGQAYTNMGDEQLRGAQGQAAALPTIIGALATDGASTVPGIAGILAKMGLAGGATGATSMLMDLLSGQTPDTKKAALEGGGMALGEGVLGGSSKLVKSLAERKALVNLLTKAKAEQAVTGPNLKVLGKLQKGNVASLQNQVDNTVDPKAMLKAAGLGAGGVLGIAEAHSLLKKFGIIN